jgi:hypothetical protein
MFMSVWTIDESILAIDQKAIIFHCKLDEDILHKVSASASVKSLASLPSFIPFFSSVLIPSESSSFSHQFYRSGCSISAIPSRLPNGI